MDQVYLGNVKSTKSKKWVYIDRGLHTLERKEALLNLRIFSECDCLAHRHKRMDLIDLSTFVLCNKNSTMNSEHLFQCSSFNRERQQANYISGLCWEK